MIFFDIFGLELNSPKKKSRTRVDKFNQLPSLFEFVLILGFADENLINSTLINNDEMKSTVMSCLSDDIIVKNIFYSYLNKKNTALRFTFNI